LIFCCSWGNCW